MHVLGHLYRFRPFPLHVAGRLNSGVRLAMNRLAKVATILAILITAAMFVTPFILYFGIIAGTIAAVFKHDRHTR